MRNRVLNYMKKIDNDLLNYENDKSLTPNTLKTAIDRHLVQISFFQHERFIHLIVTFLFSLIAILGVLFSITNTNISILLLTILSIILLVPYIRHYYLLENNVQRMYKQYDKMLEILDSINPQ